MPDYTRRELTRLLLAAAAVAASPAPLAKAFAAAEGEGELFSIALASWSFHMALWRGEMEAGELPGLAKSLGVEALEWTSKTFRPLSGGRELMFQAPPAAFFNQLRAAADDAGVSNQVLGAGGPYYLATADRTVLNEALDFFLQYVEPAQVLGCNVLRAELYCDLPQGPGREGEAKKRAMEGLQALLDKTADSGLVINVENHHGVSSQAAWLADLIVSMDHPRLGLTVDTNNFRIDQPMPYRADPDQLPRYEDRYQGLEILMPLANWVSVKTYAFDSTGYEASMNYPRIMDIIRASGYRGHLSIEYEGAGDPLDGVRKSVEMLDKLQRHFFEEA